MIVNTPLGPVAGRGTRTPDGPVAQFLGMPYAEAPGSSGRFRVAAPARGHRGVFDATSPAPAAPQDPDIFGEMLGMPPQPWAEAASLSANVWAPVGAAGLPVMVWVHGGAYVGGSNSLPRTDGARLAAAGNVVVVALSYRLGVFGFLPAFAELGEGFEDAANLGILDLIAGLEWVRENVGAFGGDPSLVTVFGESAGAAAVGTMLGMPRARGLFRRAIMQSGTAERARTPDRAADVSGRFLHAAGLTPATSRDLLDWPAERVLDAQRAFTEVVAADSVGIPLPFQPAIDGRSIPRLPLDAIRDGVSSEVRPGRRNQPQRGKLLHGARWGRGLAPTNGSRKRSTCSCVRIFRRSLPTVRPRDTGKSSAQSSAGSPHPPRPLRRSCRICSIASPAIACSRRGPRHPLARIRTSSRGRVPRCPGSAAVTPWTCLSCSGSSTTPRPWRSWAPIHRLGSARR